MSKREIDKQIDELCARIERKAKATRGECPTIGWMAGRVLELLDKKKEAAQCQA